MEFEYVWLHIPTGCGGIKKITMLDRRYFLEMLNRWNAQQPKVWKYWEKT